MSAGPSPARARSAAHVKAAAIASGSVPSIVRLGRRNRRPCRRRRAPPIDRARASRARSVVLQAEDDRQFPRGAHVDRFVPLAERRSAFADERDADTRCLLAREGEAHARHREAADRQRRGRRDDAPVEVADVKIAPVHGRASLPHLRAQHHSHRRRLGPHRDRRAQIADDRPDHVTGPRAVFPPLGTATKPNGRRVDRFLTERSESLALKRRRSVAHFRTGEKGLEAIVDGAREHHATQDLAPFVRRQARGDRFTTEKPVAGRKHGVHALAKALPDGDAGRRFDTVGCLRPLDVLPQRLRKWRAKRVDRRFGRRRFRGDDRIECLERRFDRERRLLGDEGREAIAKGA